MLNDLFSIGPFTVHSYGLCIAIGLLACLWLACVRARKVGLSDDVCYGILYSGVITGFIGAKLLFIVVEWKDFIKDPVSFISTSGFVVFGGLTFGVLGAYVYCRIRKANFMSYFDLVAPSIALAQGFGRIGCFMAGCCYGRPTDSFLGVTFHNSFYAPNNVSLLPTQLFSAAGDFLILAILLYLDRKVTKKGMLAGIYIVLYSVGRFFIEFLRNDNRGGVGVLSTSQFYGIITVVAGVIIILVANKMNVARPPLVTTFTTDESCDDNTNKDAE